MLLPLLIVSALQAAPVPAPPAPKTPTEAPLTYAPAKAAEAKDNQLVCRTEAVLGSRMPVRRCHTVADIRDRQLSDRQEIEHAQILQEPSH